MDAVRTAIMSNRFNAIVEEASAAVYRTAHTTFVKLVQDYQCAVATVDGDMFAYPMLSGVNVFVGSLCCLFAERRADRMMAGAAACRSLAGSGHCCRSGIRTRMT